MYLKLGVEASRGKVLQKKVSLSSFKALQIVLRGSGRELFYLSILLTTSSFFELISVSLLGSYTLLVLTSNVQVPGLSVDATSFLKDYSLTHLILGTSALVLLTYIFKNYFSLQVQKRLISFSFSRQREIILRLLKLYQNMPYEKLRQKNTSSL